MLDDPACIQRAAEVGKQVEAEDGVAVACDAIDSLLDARARMG